MSKRQTTPAVSDSGRDSAGLPGFRARGGKGVSPFLSLRRRSRAWAGAPSKPTRRPPPGGMRRKGGTVRPAQRFRLEWVWL